MLNLMGVLNATTANVSCTCNCKRYTSLQSMEITQLEFVQILVIVVVMMVMVVVITCLLNHYRLSARSLLTRHTTERRRHQPLANEAALWSSEGTNAALNEPQVYSPRPTDRSVPSTSYLQTQVQPQRFQSVYGASRFQPTYPYLPQSLIDLPPTIALSDGEEPPPYAGPCTLQLRDPEQQMELNRESVRAPPNRTVFDSQLVRHSNCLHHSLQAPPPSVNPGVSVLEAQEAASRLHKQAASRVEGAPPTYSEVIGHFYHPSALTPNNRTVPASQTLIHGLLHGSTDQRNNRNNKDKPQQV